MKPLMPKKKQLKCGCWTINRNVLGQLLTDQQWQATNANHRRHCPHGKKRKHKTALRGKMTYEELSRYYFEFRWWKYLAVFLIGVTLGYFSH